MSDTRYVCPKNKVVFFPFYKTFTNWVTLPYECKQNIDANVPIFVEKKQNHTSLDIIQGNRHKYFILFLIFVSFILSFVAFGIFIIHYLQDGFNKGGVALSNSRLQYILEATAIKSLLTPVLPI